MPPGTTPARSPRRGGDGGDPGRRRPHTSRRHLDTIFPGPGLAWWNCGTDPATVVGLAIGLVNGVTAGMTAGFGSRIEQRPTLNQVQGSAPMYCSIREPKPAVMPAVTPLTRPTASPTTVGGVASRSSHQAMSVVPEEVFEMPREVSRQRSAWVARHRRRGAGCGPVGTRPVRRRRTDAGRCRRGWGTVRCRTAPRASGGTAPPPGHEGCRPSGPGRPSGGYAAPAPAHPGTSRAVRTGSHRAAAGFPASRRRYSAIDSVSSSPSVIPAALFSRTDRSPASRTASRYWSSGGENEALAWTQGGVDGGDGPAAAAAGISSRPSSTGRSRR